MDNLFEQMAQITKAHAYDIMVEEVKFQKFIIDEIEKKIKDDDITAIREKAIFSEFDSLLKEIEFLINKSRLPKI